MRWVVKVAETLGQHRITLPKTFCKEHNIDQGEYLVIDDRDPANITIRRLIHAKEKKAESG